MLAEILLVLAGHPSSFFIPHPAESPSTLRLSPKLERYLHPGEISSLNTLADIAYQYSTIRTWATQQLESTRNGIHASTRKGKQKELDADLQGTQQCVYTATLASAILDHLKAYEEEIVRLEMRILKMDEGVVQDSKGYVPLSILVAAFSGWVAPLHSLFNLVDTIKKDVPTPGALIHLVQSRTQTGNPDLRGTYEGLSIVLERLFIRHLTIFVLFGQASTTSSRISPSFTLDTGPDPISPRHRIYEINEDLVPLSVSQRTRESLMYVGRVTATLKREGKELPRSMVQDLQASFEGSIETRGSDMGWERLDEVVRLTREEVGEWLWQHVLTGSQIIESLEVFGNYFLTRRADHTLSVIEEITRLCRTKLTTSNPTSSSSVIRDTDLQLAWLRASVGTSAEHDRNLDKIRLKFDNGPLRAVPAPTRRSTGGTSSIFSDILCGAPVTLHPTITWPLDLFITPSSRTAYCEIHAYLLALRTTHYRIRQCWASLSTARRGSRVMGEYETSEERDYIRTVWATVRLMSFWLEELLSHFMWDIIDVQHRNLLSQLDVRSDEGGLKRSGSAATSLRGSMKVVDVRNEHGGEKRTRAGSPASTYAAETVRSKLPPTPNRHTAHIDFLSLRQMHTRHLAFLKQGLLLADKGLAVVIRDILDTCIRFAGLIEKWRGDILPKSPEDGAGQANVILDSVQERWKLVDGLKVELHEHLSDFFRALVESQNPIPSGDTSTGLSESLSKSVRTTQMIQSSRVCSHQVSFNGPRGAGEKAGLGGKSKAEIERSERDQEVENLTSRHVEQLLLRLDYNGVLTNWLDEEHQATSTAVLAEGGL